MLCALDPESNHVQDVYGGKLDVDDAVFRKLKLARDVQERIAAILGTPRSELFPESSEPQAVAS